MTKKITDWIVSHRRILLLKAVVASVLIMAHYFPDSRAGLLANLLWLMVF